MPSATQSSKPEKQRRNVALVRADMMRGQISLVPAEGFCIDKRSLKQNSAVLARCDSLGGTGGALDAPLGLLLVSIVETVEAPGDLPGLLDQLIPAGTETVSRRDGDRLSIARLQGHTPVGADPTHWRAVSRIGPHVLSVVGFAPDGGALSGPDGAHAISSMIARTQDDSIARDVARGTAKEATSGKKGLGGIFKGLFD